MMAANPLPLPVQSAFPDTLSVSPSRCPPSPMRKLSPRSKALRDRGQILHFLRAQPPHGSPVLTSLREEFLVLGDLGKGTHTEVKLVRSHLDGQEYAVKRQLAGYHSAGVSMKPEIEIIKYMADNSHPNVVVYHKAWEEGGAYHVQMEACQRGSLQSFLDQQTSLLSEEDIWNFLGHISCGLAHIHDLGVLHLDIKPENIFIDDNGILKIGDFGIAQRMAEPHLKDFEDGDQMYMPAEILGVTFDPASAAAVLKPSCDVFSLGIMVYSMAAGMILPRDGVMWQQLRAGNCPLPDFRSHDLAILLQRMMHPTPSERPSAHEVYALVSEKFALPPLAMEGTAEAMDM